MTRRKIDVAQLQKLRAYLATHRRTQIAPPDRRSDRRTGAEITRDQQTTGGGDAATGRENGGRKGKK